MKSFVPRQANVSIRPIKGSAVSGYAYRFGEKELSERWENIYNFSYRREVHKDILHVETAMPGFTADKAEFDWARNARTRWNNAENTELSRGKKRVIAHDHRVELPPGLNLRQEIALLHGYAQENADRYRTSMDVAIHDRREGRAKTRHSHIMQPLRKLSPYGFGEYTDFTVEGQERRARGLDPKIEGREYEWKRTTWERHVERAMIEAGLQHSSDYASFKARHLSGLSEPLSAEEKLAKNRVQNEDRKLQRLSAADEQRLEQWRLETPRQSNAERRRQRDMQLELARAWEREQALPAVAAPMQPIAPAAKAQTQLERFAHSSEGLEWFSFGQRVNEQIESSRTHSEDLRSRDLVSLSQLLQERHQQSANDGQLNVLRLKQPQAKQFDQDRAAFYSMTRDWLALKLARDRHRFRERAKGRAYAPVWTPMYASSNDLGM